jgi:hypothetical protein
MFLIEGWSRLDLPCSPAATLVVFLTLGRDLELWQYHLALAASLSRSCLFLWVDISLQFQVHVALYLLCITQMTPPFASLTNVLLSLTLAFIILECTSQHLRLS